MQIIGEWITRLLFWNNRGLIILRNFRHEKVVSDGHGHHCGWHEHRVHGADICTVYFCFYVEIGW